MTSAAVVGSGPNGLAAAIRLAQAGLEVTVLEASDRIGGGARTSELTLPGLLHDDCSAAHPLGVVSPYLRSLGLDRFGLTWRWADIDLAHPLDDGRAGTLSRGDGAPPDAGLDALLDEVLQPVAHLPRHPVALARFGVQALVPATVLARRWSDETERALFVGTAAHAVGRLDTPMSSAVGLLLGEVGRRAGWPVAEGGSGRITEAMVALLTSLGGRVRTGVRVDRLDELEPSDLVLLDTSPTAAARIVGDRLAPRVRRALERYTYGGAAHKVDLAIEGDIPWRNEETRRAGTVHLGGTVAEIAAAEADVVRGRMPERPFVLVCQQYLADPTRSVGGHRPIWAYAHVPHGYTGDATEALLAQIERFAPGFRERIVATHVRGPAALAAYNENYVGGDIATGGTGLRQLLFRPRPAVDPYRLADGVYLCSSATPPGPGVHGMCGFHAAESALDGLGGGRRRGHRED